MANERTPRDPESGAPGPFSPSDLPINADGRTYHLCVRQDEVAPDILLVGDPGRAALIGETLLDSVEMARQHRGLRTVTGTYRGSCGKPLRVTVATSGMGTPSLEIVVQELVALHEVDLATGRRRASWPTLNVIRVGTSGGIQPTTPLGTPIVTSYSIGLDNTGLFYEAAVPDEICARLEPRVRTLVIGAMRPGSRFAGCIRPYVSRAHAAVVVALTSGAATLGVEVKTGLTASNSGFFAGQGRDVARVPSSVADTEALLGGFDPDVDGQRVENMEMEASFLLHFLGALGHRGGAICPVIANRLEGRFLKDYQGAVTEAARTALEALRLLRRGDEV